jgi:hypothetical protein
VLGSLQKGLWVVGVVVLGVGFAALPVRAQVLDTFTANSSTTANHNSSTFRGFDPGAISNPNDPFPDTSIPCCLANSTQFGNGVPSGSSLGSIEQNQSGSISDSGFPQTSSSSLLSGPGALSGERANHLETSFNQEVVEQGQLFNMAFSIDSMTDADGNLLGQATGSFTQVVSDPVTTQGVTRVCSGTFTFDEVSGFSLTSGPLHQC